MPTKQIARSLAFTTVAFAGTIGCNRDVVTNPTPKSISAAPKPSQSTGVVRGSRYPRPSEDRFVQLAQEDPSIAGFYLDPDGSLVVQVVDSGHFDAARQIIARRLATDGLDLPVPYRQGRIVVRKAQYTFQQLSDWRDAVTESMLGSYGIVSNDLDEAHNRVLVHYKSGPEVAIRRSLNDQQIPQDAVTLVQSDGVRDAVGPVELARSTRKRAMFPSSLTSGIVDTAGGGQEVTTPIGSCSLGFTAMVSGVKRPVTASHCSAFWTLDSSQMKITGKVIAIETVDPDPSNCSALEIALAICFKTRRSDASMYTRTSDSVVVRVGLIARAVPRTSGAAGSTTISTTSPWLYITGTAAATYGQAVEKMGKSTGWTYGSVTGTCVDFYKASNKVQCQDEASVFGGLGDSGAPFFAWDGQDGATLLGIAVGINCSSCTSINDTYFTPMSAIFNDLGSMSVATDITLGGITPTASYSTAPYLTWSAPSVTGTSTATTYSIYRDSWDSSSYTYADQGDNLGTQTTTSITDSSTPVSVSSYYGTSKPNACTYSYIRYVVVAYNSGLSAVSQEYYFLGAADGATPGAINCQ